MGAIMRYPRALLDRAWARSAALRMAPETMPVPEPAELTTPLDLEDEVFPEETLEEARRDPAAFNAFVLRDAETGNSVANAPHHIDFQRVLSDPANARCVILAFAESGKTTSISVGRVLWELGHNPNLRIGILCESTPRAAEIVDLIAQYIRESAPTSTPAIGS